MEKLGSLAFELVQELNKSTIDEWSCDLGKWQLVIKKIKKDG